MNDRMSLLPLQLPTDFHRPMFCLLGVAFDIVEMPAVLARMKQAARERNRVVLSTPNVNNIVTVQRNAAYRDAVAGCELVVPDGMPLVWLARLLGIHTRRIAGSDLFQLLMNGEAGPLRVFFFGAPEGVAQTACERLNRDGGPVSGAGWHYPGFGSVADMTAPEVLASINATAPDFVVLALGTAKGQQWIERAGPGLTAPLLSHLGAVVNFVAGSVRRAPLWMQNLGFEWLWRIREEPALWRRYATDGWALGGLCLRSVLPLVLRRLWRGVVPVRSSARIELAVLEAGQKRLTLSGNWLPADLAALRDTLTALTATDSAVVIDAQALGWVDQTFIGLLIRLYGHQRKRGQRFVIDRPSAALARQLRWHCADYLLTAVEVKDIHFTKNGAQAWKQ
jgi:N-acetylglucosaminyldiphosphoundecaprenol N-acetyl-beta-D-mannosaminyltransferase